MTHRNELQQQSVHAASAGRRMLQGAGIALIIITAFLLSAGEANPAWPTLWIIKPLIIVPLAGALGGLFYYNMDPLRHQGGWRTVLAIVLSVMVYLVVLWLGVVLGLNGTMWD
ncbi:potassium transporter KefB [Flavihumibacter sp. R14]|nr:potassium transporter KefB [Flavihumibacter soli]